MKATFILVLLIGFSALAAGPSGDLSQWKGRYETTKCINCPDYKISSGANLKNFIRFALGFGEIDPKVRLSCAQTNIWIGMDFVIQSDDKSDTSSIGHSTGQCDWNEKFGESLVVTNDVLSYQSNGLHEKMSLSLSRVDVNTYLFHQVVHRDDSAWGYPNDWEYQVEMKKVDSNP